MAIYVYVARRERVCGRKEKGESQPPFQTAGIIFILWSEQYPKKSSNLYEDSMSSSELCLVKVLIRFEVSR